MIDAEILTRYLENWIADEENCDGISPFIVATSLKKVLCHVKALPTVQPECTCRKWHPASETPPLHHEVDEDKCEGPLEYDVSEPLLLYTEEEGYKVGVYMKDCYGFNGWLNPEYGGTIRHVVEWRYLPKPSKETGK